MKKISTEGIVGKPGKNVKQRCFSGELRALATEGRSRKRMVLKGVKWARLD